MDTVACYGSESRLIDCSHHTDTSEDSHSDDIWIECSNSKTIPTKSTTITDAAAVHDDGSVNLAAAVYTPLVLGLVMVMIAIAAFVTVGVMLYKKRRQKEGDSQG